MGDGCACIYFQRNWFHGLIERENATILNAALYRVAERFTEGFANSLAEEGIEHADVYLSQNDGTLMTMEYARRYPILTVACGPTNSIRGAGYLSHIQNAIVVDVAVPQRISA